MRFNRNLVFDTIDDVARQTELPRISVALTAAAEKFGLTSLGINSLPPPGVDADPLVLTERAPEGFRGFYIEERFYLVDHICAQARVAVEPFRFDEAVYDETQASAYRRFMQALDTWGMSQGLVIPVGRPANIPTCLWLSGDDPQLDDDAMRAMQLIGLFAASKARALTSPTAEEPRPCKLTQGERNILQWISAGKTSWEIGSIAGLSERAVNKIVAAAMVKLEAVTRTQAVVTAIRLGEIEL